MTSPAVTFVIPIRHPDGVRDRALQQRTLAQTFASIGAQSSGAWRLRVACNPGQPLPPLPDRAEVVEVDLAPVVQAFAEAGSLEETHRIFRRDKGLRVAAAIEDLGPDDRFMVVDDDDLVSRRLARFFERADPRRAYHVDRGWTWIEGRASLRMLDGFHGACGTCLAAPKRLWRIHESDGGADALQELGSHRLIYDRLAGTDDAFSSVPFRAAVYRLSHVNSTEHLMNRFGPSRRGLRKRMRPGGRFVTRLRTRAAHYAQFRPIFPILQREFFGGIELRRAA